jgi:hypothetical protein
MAEYRCYAVLGRHGYTSSDGDHRASKRSYLILDADVLQWADHGHFWGCGFHNLVQATPKELRWAEQHRIWKARMMTRKRMGRACSTALRRPSFPSSSVELLYSYSAPRLDRADLQCAFEPVITKVQCCSPSGSPRGASRLRSLS